MSTSTKNKTFFVGFTKTFSDSISLLLEKILPAYEGESIQNLRDIKTCLLQDSNSLILIMAPKGIEDKRAFCNELLELTKISPSVIFTESDNNELQKEALELGLTGLININDLSLPLLKVAIESSQKAFHLNCLLNQTVSNYMHLFEQSPQPMLIYKEEDLTIINVNETALKLYDYTREEFLKLSIKELRPEEDLHKLFEAIDERKKGNTEFKNHSRHLKKGGEVFYVEIKSVALNVDGNKARLILATDITERINAKKALVLNENRLKLLLKYSADLVGILNEEGQLQYITPSTEVVLGHKIKQLIGENLLGYIHNEDVEKFANKFQTTHHTSKRIKMPLVRIRNASGQWRWINSTVINLSDEPGINGLVINGRDVTADFENQLKIQESSERYENVARVSNDVIYTHNFIHRLTTIAGTSHKSIFGHKLPAVHMEREFWKEKIHPDDLDRTEEKLAAFLNDEKSQQGSLEYRFLKADGNYADILDSFFVRRKNGELYDLQGAMRDISAQKFHERIISFEKDVYALNARANMSTVDLLNEVALKVESIISDAHCSILELDDHRITHHVAAPNLPREYCDELNGFRIGPRTGSCGTAMYLGTNVIVSDISTDPLWSDYAELAKKHQLKACWSIPIKSRSGVVVGSFATYHKTVKTPTEHDLKYIERAAHVLGTLMEGWKAREATNLSNERYNLAAKATKDIIWDHDVSKDITTYNEGINTILGYPLSERIQYSNWWPERIHPNDLEHVMTAFESLKKGGSHITLKYRFRCADNTYRHFEDKAYVVRNENGDLKRIIGAMHDITDFVKNLQEIEAQNKKLKEITWQQSHEVRAPLSRIMGLVNLLEMSTFKEIEEKTILGHIKDSANEMDGVIRSIVSKIDEEKIELKY